MSDVGLSLPGEPSAGFVFQPICIGTIGAGEAGMLVLKSDQLVAVLTRVDEELYATKGQWFLETGFGRLSGSHRIFDSLEEAQTWIDGRLCSTIATLGMLTVGQVAFP